ncbi:MAG: D-tyrosyl-tRNA(Tyr) deacylase [Opitutae bacterium]|jgi:D-aminoacyl-tRNA deacylase|nr:D-tyrosyl-tRNA(Tyr) deacylase [Opitutae bacterium]MBT5715558.1 D-tyrosyl-tRNA(Tyr) deacylase [Opitutae bacterium]
MRALIRRVLCASVKVDSQTVGQIGQGLAIYVGFHMTDIDEDLHWMSKKLLGLRIFEDDTNKMNYSVSDKKFDLLIISQFTLFGSLKKGFRPSFNQAASTEVAYRKYYEFIKIINSQFIGHIAEGEFGKDMQISSIDDGPVSIWLDSRNKSY